MQLRIINLAHVLRLQFLRQDTCLGFFAVHQKNFLH